MSDRALPPSSKGTPTDSTTWATFVEEYMKDFSATGAYTRTYGGSQASAKATGPRLIRSNGWIRNEIARRSEGKITLATITPERITLELARIALFDARKTVAINVVEEKGETRLRQDEIPLAMLDEDTARGITGISYDVRGNRVLKTDKVAALQTLAKITMADPTKDQRSVPGRAGTIEHEVAGDDEIALMLEEFNDRDPDDAVSAGDEIEGEYADTDE